LKKLVLSTSIIFSIVAILFIIPFAYADEHDDYKFFLKTDKNEYEYGDTVYISGIANHPYFFDRSITGMIISPDNNLIHVVQMTPYAEYFKTSFKIVGESWSEPGEYIAEFVHGSDRIQIIINYVGEDPDPIITECDPSYPDICIVQYPPDLNCDDIIYANFRVIGEDLHRFDGDNDGIGCESY